MADAFPPSYPMDADHRGASTVITSYSLLVYTLCAGLVRIYVSRRAETKASYDDIGVLAAIVGLRRTYFHEHVESNTNGTQS